MFREREKKEDMSESNSIYLEKAKEAFMSNGVSSGRMYTFHPSAPYLYYIMYDPKLRTSGFYEYNYSDPATFKPHRIGEELLASSLGTLSKEEELLRERMRENLTGVTSYTFNAKTLDFLVPSGRTLILYNVADPAHPTMRVVWEGCTEPRLDTKLSADGRFVSYVYDSDLWILPLCASSGKPVKVTDSKVRPNLTCACADYILEEEFSLYTGYFVSPANPSGAPNEYRILYFEDDSNDVEDYTPPPIPAGFAVAENTEIPETVKYPKPGAPNSRLTLCMMDLCVGDDGTVSVRRVGRVDQTLGGLYPNAEYFARVGWCRDGRRVYLQVLDRRQRNLDVVLVKADAFFGSASELENAVTVMKRQKDAHWINVFDVFEELDDGSFIWASEEHPNGFMRLVRLVPERGGASYRCVDLFESSEELYAANGSVSVDQKNKRVAFVGYEKPPLQKRCFVVSYEGNDVTTVKTPMRVSSDKFSISDYAVKFAEDGKSAIFAFEQSSIDAAPFVSITQATFVPEKGPCGGCGVESKFVVPLFSSELPENKVRPQAFSFYSMRRGERLYGFYFAPPVPMCEKCPVAVSIYGGTHAKIVNDEYAFAFHPQRQLYAANGLYVVCLDNVGSFNRGHKFESHIDERMGTIEIDDQIEALHYLAYTLKVPIDLSRVAIFGWSYGGYMSLMGIAQHPEVFKVSLVGAPVTMWEEYDTGYTERYMGVPTTPEVKRAYQRGSVFTYLDGIPKDKARIAIVHGISDENVHIDHTLALTKRLREMGVPFEIRAYPGERHGFRKPENIFSYHAFYLEFLLKNI